MKTKNHHFKSALIVLAVIGMTIMAYLFSLRFLSGDSAFCNLGEGLSCDVVNQSAYATVFGIPLSALGFLYFAGVLLAVLWKYSEATLRSIAFVSIAFLGPSLYLTGIEIFVLESICVFCELSKILMAVIISICLFVARPRVSSKWIGAALLSALMLGGVTYAAQANKVPSGRYNLFAQCLYEKGFRMYGAKTCAACAKQRALFGDAIQFIHEIECDPRYENNEVERCVAKRIETTPTWIVEDAEGNTLRRFDPGVLSLETLRDASGCSLP